MNVSTSVLRTSHFPGHPSSSTREWWDPGSLLSFLSKGPGPSSLNISYPRRRSSSVGLLLGPFICGSMERGGRGVTGRKTTLRGNWFKLIFGYTFPKMNILDESSRGSPPLFPPRPTSCLDCTPHPVYLP